MQNWKTTLTGVGIILSALGDIAHNFPAPNWQADVTAIIGGIGLILAADAKKG
jgi:hypothetical protein